MTEEGQKSETRSEQQEKINYEPCIVVLAGLPLVGKSTLAKELSEITNFIYLDVDQIRHELFNPSLKRFSVDQEDSEMLTSYQEMHKKARDLLISGKPVLLIATYSKVKGHNDLEQLSQETGKPLKFFLLTAHEHEIRKRMDARNKQSSLSNVKTWEHFKSVQERYIEAQNLDIFRINTTEPINESLNKILGELENLKKRV